MLTHRDGHLNRIAASSIAVGDQPVAPTIGHLGGIGRNLLDYSLHPSNVRIIGSSVMSAWRGVTVT